MIFFAAWLSEPSNSAAAISKEVILFIHSPGA